MMRHLTYFMIFVCLSTAIGVIWIRHENRVSYSHLEDRWKVRDKLNIEWYQLRLEQAAFSRFDQLENWAESTEKLVKPPEHVVLIMPKTPDEHFKNWNSP